MKTETNRPRGYAAPAVRIIDICVEQGFSASTTFPGGDVETNPFTFSTDDEFTFE